ncbi:hypothetical protein ACGTN6_20485, partial [Halomonas sp. THAF12]|uniref:hypothetical protein n=1 Tax=Halomonas sp. B23F22_10 TaxID=3459515 RepID=UPI00373EED85
QPASTEAEQSLLGGLMLENRLGDCIADRFAFQSLALLTSQGISIGDAIVLASIETYQWSGMEEPS